MAGGVAYRGDYHYVPAPLSGDTVSKNLGGVAEVAFTGSKISVGLLGWVNRGNAEVFIDGVKVGSVDGYTGQVQLVKWNSQTLACGTHTLKITQSDTAGKNGGRIVALDYVEYSGCGSSGFVCAKVAGSGGNQNGCTAAGQSCSLGPSEVDTCWGNGGGNGRCYDCNADSVVNILDFACFAKRWLNRI